MMLLLALAAPSAAQPIRGAEGSKGIDPAEKGRPADQRVLLIHDSIGLGARDQVAAAHPNSQVNFLGFVGFRADVAAELLSRQTQLISEHVVVQLGSNYGNESLFRRDLDRLMLLLADVDHVTWLTPPRYRPEMDAITAEVFAATRRHPNLQAAHWGALADANPLFTWEDGIHLRTEGAEAMAEMIRSHLEGDVPWNRIPLGSITDIRDGRRSVSFSGWAFDPDLGKRATIRITANGVELKRQKTNERRAGVANYLGTDVTKLGFSVRLNLPDGEQRICVEVNNFDGLAPVEVDCRTLVLSHEPFGSFDRVVIDGAEQTIFGWAIEPDLDGPVTIEIRRKNAKGPVITSALAERRRVGLESFGKGLNHGFAIKIASDIDDYCVVARNEFAGTSSTVLGCQ